MARHLFRTSLTALPERWLKTALRPLAKSRSRDEIVPISDAKFPLGDFLANLGTGEVTAPDGTRTTLRRKSAAVLRLLATNSGRNVSKDEIFQQVWQGIAVTDDSLVQCIGEIRRAIGDDAHRIVRTAPGEGYRLCPESSQIPPGSSPRRLPATIAAAVAALVVLAAIALFLPSSVPSTPSIAVMPFEDLSNDSRWTRMGKGIAAEVATDLARSRLIIVIPPETVATVVASNNLEAAQTLGVRFVMDGTLQADGTNVRVTSRLLDARSGGVVWTDRWEGPAAKLLELQDRIVGSIVAQIDGTWSGAIARSLKQNAMNGTSESLDARELYWRAIEAKHRFTEEGYTEATGYLREALTIDPNYVDAIVALSIVTQNLADITVDQAGSDALLVEARRLAERAVAIDPVHPQALVRLAGTRVLEGRRDDAAGLVDRAVELAPNNPDVLAGAAWAYPFADEDRHPAKWIRKAIALNPAHPDWYDIPLGWAALFDGDIDLARRAARDAPPGPDAWVTLAVAEALAGNLDESRRLFGLLVAETPYRSLSGYFLVDDLSEDPAFRVLVDGTRLSGFPVSEAEAR